MSAFLRLSLFCTMTILSFSKKNSEISIAPENSVQVVDNEPLVPKDVKDAFVFSTGTFFNEHDPRKIRDSCLQKKMRRSRIHKELNT